MFCSGLCGMKDLISPIREPMDRTPAACSGSTESKALDHQGNPKNGDWFWSWLCTQHVYVCYIPYQSRAGQFYPYADLFLNSVKIWHGDNLRSMLLLLLSRFSRVRLCNPIDSSPPGSPILGILQARTLEWVAISFCNVWKWKVKVKSLSRVRLPATPWTAAHQAPPSTGFSRQEYWSGLPLPSPPASWAFPNYSRWGQLSVYLLAFLELLIFLCHFLVIWLSATCSSLMCVSFLTGEVGVIPPPDPTELLWGLMYVKCS